MYFWWLFHNYSCPFTSQKDEVISSPQVWIAYNMQPNKNSNTLHLTKNLYIYKHAADSTLMTPCKKHSYYPR